MMLLISGTDSCSWKVSGASYQHLKRSVNRFDLRIMQSDNAVPGGDAPVLYKNYFPSFLILYKQLRKANDPSAAEWEALIRRLAKRTGDSIKIENELKH